MPSEGLIAEEIGGWAIEGWGIAPRPRSTSSPEVGRTPAPDLPSPQRGRRRAVNQPSYLVD